MSADLPSSDAPHSPGVAASAGPAAPTLPPGAAGHGGPVRPSWLDRIADKSLDAAEAKFGPMRPGHWDKTSELLLHMERVIGIYTDDREWERAELRDRAAQFKSIGD